MNSRRLALVAALVALAGVWSLSSRAAPAAKVDQPAPKTITVETGRAKNGAFTLAGRDAWQQILVTGQYSGGPVRDLTRAVTYQAAPADVVKIEPGGLVRPVKEGKATITVKAPGGVTGKVDVVVSNIAEDLPINFPNQVVPVFTKFGCNAGGCHGKASGQNGFKLSLLGFEPTEDYEYLVKEARGRRLMPAAPAHSLLLLKATGTMAHGGGKKIEPGSPYYNLLRRWIEQGAPFGRAEDPTVQRIEVLPRERTLERNSEQQLAVIAHLSDGSTVDVTRMTQFEPNYPDMAEVSETGLVGVKGLPGVVAIMARFQSHVDVFRATVPLGAVVDKLPATRNFVDELVFKQLKKLGLPPSQPADDGTFIRRATIDIAGRLPTKEEVEQFRADQDPKKHEKLIDRLLDSGDYADYFALKWSAILRNRRKTDKDDPKPTFAFHAWIRESLAKNLSYDQLVRGVLTATGEEVKTPPVIWYREVRDPAAQLEDTAQLFLGQRLQCAKCHHHPFEKWSQDDYYGLAAFFSRVQIKDPPPPKKKPKKGQPPPKREPFQVSHRSGVAQMVNTKTNQPIKPTPLGGKTLNLDKDMDPRVKLVDWMVQKDNPFFAHTLANRYWKHFMGRGLVEPEDDMRVTNPASNPELLDALAKSFAESNYDLKALVRTICTSQVYRLSAVPNKDNAEDRQNFSRFLPKRLHAEVLLDAVDAVTLAKSRFKGVPNDLRAVQLPDNQFDSYFLSVFGRPDSASACECERSGDATLAQCLHMFNSKEILDKVKGPRASQLGKDKRPHKERLRDLYLVALSREPSPEEIATLEGYISKKKKDQEAYEDILWALLNTKEFLFNH
jgi:Protein of unknown function (DUF1549)/Protein of unknown function (DUF1553)